MYHKYNYKFTIPGEEGDKVGISTLALPNGAETGISATITPKVGSAVEYWLRLVVDSIVGSVVGSAVGSTV